MAGIQVVTGVVDEMILVFGKIAAVGSRKYNYPLGCGVFSLSSVSIKVYFRFLLFALCPTWEPVHMLCLSRQSTYNF